MAFKRCFDCVVKEIDIPGTYIHSKLIDGEWDHVVWKNEFRRVKQSVVVKIK